MTPNAKLLIVALDLRLMARQHVVGRDSALFEHTLPDRLMEAAEALEDLVRRSIRVAPCEIVH